MRALPVALIMFALPVHAETLYREQPWLVSSDYGLDGESTCNITGLLPTTALSVIASSGRYQVQALEVGANHPIEEKILIIRLPDEGSVMFDAVWMQDISNAVLDANFEWTHERVDDLLNAFEQGGDFVFYQARGSMPYDDWLASQVSISLPPAHDALDVFNLCVSNLP